MRAGAKCGKLLGGVSDFENGRDFIGHPGIGSAIILTGDIDDQNVLTLLGEKTRFGFLPQRTLVDQGFQKCRYRVVLVPGVVGQIIVHGFERMRERIETDHIGSPVSGTLGATYRRSGQRVNLIEAQLELHGVMHGCRDRKHANTVGDKIGRVVGADHAFADSGDEKSFQLIENRGLGVWRGNQFDQFHITRRIEKMYAAEAMTQRFRKYFRQLGDGKPGGVGSKNCVGPHERRDLFIQRFLPVHTLGNRFNNQIAIFEPGEIFVIVGRRDLGRTRLAGERCRL